MKKALPLISALSVFVLCACQGVPDGSKEPVATIESIKLASGQQSGFDIDFSVFHRSLEDLPFAALDIDIMVNSKKVASYHEEPEDIILKPSVKNSYTRFVEANLAQPAQSDSLLMSPMLKVNADVVLKVTVVDDEDLDTYNPVANFKGIVSHAD